MYRKIIVALDNSPLSQKAFQQSLSIAKAFNAELQLFNVISSSEAEYRDTVSLTGSGYYSQNASTINEIKQEKWQLLVENNFDDLQSLVEQAAQVGVSAELVQEIGQPERQICKYAQEWEADLIVIGSHGRKGLSELLIGSVSNYVSHNVPCDVMLVHQQAN